MLRPAVDSDKDQILRWRNHPEVRAVSHTSHVISPEEHNNWWNRVKKDETSLVLIYERDGEPSGVVSFFNMDQESAWWGYYLDNQGLNERGALFPAWIQIQREALKYANKTLGLKQLDAETLNINEAAVAFNERMGFQVVSVTDSVFDGQPIQVIHSRRVWE